MSPFPQRIHDAARALMLVEGESSSRTERRLAELFPGQKIPDSRTLRLWRADMPEVTTQERTLIESREREAILRGHNALERWFDAYDNASTADILKYGMTANAITGTMTDKQLQRSRTTTDQHTVIPVQIVINTASD